MFIKLIEDLAREEGKYKAVGVKREYDDMEELAQQKLEEARAVAVKAAEESEKRAITAQQAMEAQRAAASSANVSRPPGLSEPIRPTTNKIAFSIREADAACVNVDPKEEEDTPLVRQAIEARKSVYRNYYEGMAQEM